MAGSHLFRVLPVKCRKTLNQVSACVVEQASSRYARLCEEKLYMVENSSYRDFEDKPVMNHLRNAVNKCHRFSDTKQYCGALIPMEILALVNAGAKNPHPERDWQSVDWAEQDKIAGISKKQWFYFVPPKGIFMDDGRHDAKIILG